jgi:uncharacterized membrane protein (DUF373 family)
MTFLDHLNKFERGIYYTLSILLGLVIFFSVLELVFIVYKGIFEVSSYQLENHEIIEIFGFFLLILIGIELLDTIKAYIQENRIHVEIILLVAIIAIARKVILLDPFAEGISDVILLGLAAILIALCGGYYLIKKSGFSESAGKKKIVE